MEINQDKAMQTRQTRAQLEAERRQALENAVISFGLRCLETPAALTPDANRFCMCRVIMIKQILFIN